jgi:hypothetical protein
VYEGIKGSTIRFTGLIYGMHDYYLRLVCSIADCLLTRSVNVLGFSSSVSEVTVHNIRLVLSISLKRMVWLLYRSK